MLASTQSKYISLYVQLNIFPFGRQHMSTLCMMSTLCALNGDVDTCRECYCNLNSAYIHRRPQYNNQI